MQICRMPWEPHILEEEENSVYDLDLEEEKEFMELMKLLVECDDA